MRSLRIAHVLGIGGLVAAAGLFTATVAAAQETPPAGAPAADGTLTGEVAHCVNGVEQPLSDAQVSLDGLNQTVRTDPEGLFALTVPVGSYTLVATQGDSVLGSRPNVPVVSNQTIDVGIVDLSGGCAAGSGTVAPAPDPNVAAQPADESLAPPTPTTTSDADDIESPTNAARDGH